ncbi:amino acid ABC transporter permease [Plastoroseomonas hellenica]|uniref:Amino acid ABC transporter permease n=1 Tax=Plastoroseomonas hellenica TaxID=2687306 RepID=A0ABS5EXK5_9PROT|nr:amino acid ABC transporter permease [Plastoroseomonas hellenica]MBR0643198.1 amino acid ABC transporter permease [Plastoroseomonas hellenica]MBR0665032.1 amino acid ABC transporter permease [Plastoroseomonas hellenica]
MASDTTTTQLAVATAVPEAAPRTPPISVIGPIAWMRANLFSGWISTAVTLALAYLIARWVIGFVDWAFINAIWSVPNNQTQACRDLRGTGACWAVVTEKHRFILFGTYPYEQHWRPALVCVLFVGLYIVSAMRRFWRKELALVWILALTAIGILMWGGILGMPYVPQERWGGLPITLILSTFGLAFAFPLAILVALGRRSKMPAIKAICVLYVELIRGVPLISLLFMASVMFPLFLPEGMNIDKLLRAQIAIILFAGAYLAEVVRGGLQALDKGQYEAADALGLSYWHKTSFIILPQALRLVIPPLVNTFIGFFKDTSLVLIIGIFDLLTAGKTAIVEPAWQGFGVEVYITIGLIYFCFCFAMSKYSQGLEAELNRHRRR